MRIDRVKLAAALARADMTTVQLAKIAGVSRGTVSVVKGGKSCTEKTAQRIADGLGIPLSDLLAKEDVR